MENLSKNPKLVMLNTIAVLKYLFILSFLFTIVSQVLGASSMTADGCEYALLPKLNFVDSHRGKFTDQDKISISEIINKASKIFGNLAVPSELEIQRGAEFSYKYGVIKVPVSVRMNEAFLIHEFGHAILDFNFMLKIAEYLGPDSIEVLKRRARLQHMLDKSYYDDYFPKVSWLPQLAYINEPAQVDPRSCTAESDACYGRYRAVLAEYRLNEDKLKQLSQDRNFDYEYFLGGGTPEAKKEMFFHQLREYDELFADLAAALHLKDKDAIMTPLLESYPLDRRNLRTQLWCSWRSFSSITPVKGWTYDSESPHGAMAPTRSYIGGFFFDGAVNQFEPLIESVFETIWRLGLEHSKKGKSVESASLNAKFINELNDELYKRKTFNYAYFLYLRIASMAWHR